MGGLCSKGVQSLNYQKGQKVARKSSMNVRDFKSKYDKIFIDIEIKYNLLKFVSLKEC